MNINDIINGKVNESGINNASESDLFDKHDKAKVMRAICLAYLK